MAPGKMATFQPVVPARRQASEANRIALTRCCPLIAKPSRRSRVGVGTIRQAAKRSSVEMPRVSGTAGLERSTTCFRATCARNVSRGSIARADAGEPTSIFKVRNALALGEVQDSTSRGLQRPGRPEV